MLETLIISIDKWKTTKNERQKLQHAYLVSAMLIVLVAGVISLFNASLGHNVVKLALIAGGTFLVNALACNLFLASVIEKLPTKCKRR